MHKTLALAAAVCCAAILPAEQNYSQFEKMLGGDQEILHALNRLTFGPRPGDIEAVKNMGLRQWIDLQLHPDRIPEDKELARQVDSLVEPSAPAVAAIKRQRALLPKILTPQQIALLRTGSDQQGLDFLATLPQENAAQVLAIMPAVRQRLLPLMDADMRGILEGAAPAALAQPGQALAQGKLYRAIESDRQLQEVLVDFWYNHFNVDVKKGADRYLISAYERDAIRPHVLGRFRDLLEATANSPAMMFYLDNWESTVARPAAVNAQAGRPRSE